MSISARFYVSSIVILSALSVAAILYFSSLARSNYDDGFAAGKKPGLEEARQNTANELVLSCMDHVVYEDTSTSAQIKAAHPECSGVYADHSKELAEVGLEGF